MYSVFLLCEFHHWYLKYLLLTTLKTKGLNIDIQQLIKLSIVMTAIKNTRMPKFNLKSSFWLEGEPSWTIPPTKFSKWKPNFIMSKKSSWLLPQSLVYYYRRITEFNKVKRFNPAFHPNHVQEPPHQSTGRDILVVFSVGSRDVCQYSIVYRPGLGTDCWRNDDRIIVFTYFGRWRGSPEIDWDLKLPQNVEITTTSHQDKLWLHSYQHSVVSTATCWSTLYTGCELEKFK